MFSWRAWVWDIERRGIDSNRNRKSLSRGKPRRGRLREQMETCVMKTAVWQDETGGWMSTTGAAILWVNVGAGQVGHWTLDLDERVTLSCLRGWNQSPWGTNSTFTTFLLCDLGNIFKPLFTSVSPSIKLCLCHLADGRNDNKLLVHRSFWHIQC